MALAASPAAGQRVRVETSRARGDSVELAFTMELAAPQSAVWRTITDYDGMERFVPGVERSRRLSRTPNGQLVEQSGVAKSLPGERRVEAVIEVRERAPSLLVFHGVRGTFPRLHGYWRLRPAKAGRTWVAYRCTVGFDSPPLKLPDGLLAWVVQREITPRVRAIGREAERRAGTRR